MKMRNISLWLSLLFFMAMIASCVPPTPIKDVVTAFPATSTLLANSATPTPVATETPNPTLTPTTVPTLPVEDARQQLLGLLANNGGCHLPCLWGVMPGKSTYQEAQVILASLSSISELAPSFKPEGGAVFPVYVEKDLILNTNAGFLSVNQIVSHVAFQARELKKADSGSIEVFDSSFSNKYLGYYLLPNILTENGEPTTVMLSTMAKLPSSGVPGGFKILLLYPDQGILVNYTMQMQVSGKDIKGCPSNAHVELELFPPGNADSFFDLLEPSGWTQIIQNTYKPLDEATSLSQEEFFRIFSQPTDECILTPANLWPIPD